VRDKLKLTKKLVSQLSEEKRISVESARVSWWHNVRPTGGLRLTSAGWFALAGDLDLEFYEYKIKDPVAFNQHMILSLDRKLQMPYYIVATKGIPKSVIFFDSKEAVLANLYGDLEKFLDNYKY
jgi:hypothetical protein